MSNGIDDNNFALAPQLANLNHPDDVVGDEALSLEEKRALLASWASVRMRSRMHLRSAS